MRAVRVQQPGGNAPLVGVTQVAEPVATSDEVIVRMHVAGVNPIDGEVLRGEFGEIASYPRTLGTQGVGTVEGEGAEAGRRVMFFGGYGVVRDGSWAERAAVDRADLIPVPDNVGDEEAAAFLLPWVSAFGALRRGGFRSGQRVLVTAVGGAVGRATAQLARHLGASCVIVTAGSTAKAQRARADGFAHVVDLEATSLAEAVAAWTGGAGVDLVIDTVGGGVFADALTVTSPNATVVSVGAAAGGTSNLDLTPLRRRSVTVMGFTVMWMMSEPGLLVDAIGTLVRLLAEGAITPRIAGVFELADAGRALASRATDRPYGSYVLRIGPVDQDGAVR